MFIKINISYKYVTNNGHFLNVRLPTSKWEVLFSKLVDGKTADRLADYCALVILTVRHFPCFSLLSLFKFRKYGLGSLTKTPESGIPPRLFFVQIICCKKNTNNTYISDIRKTTVFPIQSKCHSVVSNKKREHFRNGFALSFS